MKARKKRRPQQEVALLKSRAMIARGWLTEHGINYIILLSHRFKHDITDIALVNRIKSVAAGRIVDEQITNQLEILHTEQQGLLKNKAA